MTLAGDRIAALKRDLAIALQEEDALRRLAAVRAAYAARLQAILAESQIQRSRSVAFWSRGGNLLLGLTDDNLVAYIASFLPAAEDLQRLGLTCKRFATKCIASSVPSAVAAAASTPVVAQQVELWSIVQEAARRWIVRCTEQESGWVPRRNSESWLGLVREVELLRRAARFDHMYTTENGSLTTGHSIKLFGTQEAEVVSNGNFYTVWSSTVMRAGRHYAVFTRECEYEHGCMFGVVPSNWAPTAYDEGFDNDDCCFYETDTGRCRPFLFDDDGDEIEESGDWVGIQPANRGDRIGLLLDLDEGTMSVYKNDERLGVMKAGLSGTYCWAVDLCDSRAKIHAADVPAG